MDKLIRSPQGSEEEEKLVKQAGWEIETFIKRKWDEREWETAWFVNPPVRDVRREDVCMLLIALFCSVCKASPAWLTSTSSQDTNPRKRWQSLYPRLNGH